MPAFKSGGPDVRPKLPVHGPAVVCSRPLVETALCPFFAGMKKTGQLARLPVVLSVAAAASPAGKVAFSPASAFCDSYCGVSPVLELGWSIRWSSDVRRIENSNSPLRSSRSRSPESRASTSAADARSRIGMSFGSRNTTSDSGTSVTTLRISGSRL